MSDMMQRREKAAQADHERPQPVRSGPKSPAHELTLGVEMFRGLREGTGAVNTHRLDWSDPAGLDSSLFTRFYNWLHSLTTSQL